jgi:adenylate kinase
VSTGDLIREQISAGTELGLKIKDIVAQGQLVPATTMMDLLESGLASHKDENWMLDGFPRSLEQALLFDEKCVHSGHLRFLCRSSVVSRPVTAVGASDLKRNNTFHL